MSGQNTQTTPVTVAVLGLGEAGGAFARDLLAAGAAVRGYDPAVPAPAGVQAARDEADAVAGADLVLSVNSASAAVDALRAGLPGATAETVWADLNTASPGTKRELDRLAGERGVPFTDIAIMAPVPGRGLGVPMLASGAAAHRAVTTLGELGASAEVLDGAAGAAAERKLLRSVFFKGLAAAVVEALEAGRAAGCEEWLRANIVTELAGADESTVDRLVHGTHLHAVRRTAEMAAATQMLEELGVEPAIAAASRDLLSRVSAGS
ncbi:NAD(P)-dependent oxidoreductase [Streptomyces sp. TP-A0874]|uniref:NAD(P)-dependent oxidoreductase n=1 Tax=Streptomyces sp. TP-A0874 TaxID=549819 RepID=UPI000852F9FB|nr:NAD(P)-dependent oxidoreductase [Streptomyces sp. TP-A0874]